MKERRFQLLVKILLFGCLLVLARFILFKKPVSYYKNYFRHEYSSRTIKKGWENANFKPFATIQLFSRSRVLRTSYKVDNIGGNIIGFIPIGFLLCFLVRSRYRAVIVYLLVTFTSLFFEVTQLLTGLGAFDVDDLILNSFGGLLGMFFFLIVRPLFAADATS